MSLASSFIIRSHSFSFGFRLAVKHQSETYAFAFWLRRAAASWKTRWISHWRGPALRCLRSCAGPRQPLTPAPATAPPSFPQRWVSCNPCMLLAHTVQLDLPSCNALQYASYGSSRLKLGILCAPSHAASVAQWQSSAFVMRRLAVQVRSLAPDALPGLVYPARASPRASGAGVQAFPCRRPPNKQPYRASRRDALFPGGYFNARP